LFLIVNHNMHANGVEFAGDKASLETQQASQTEGPQAVIAEALEVVAFGSLGELTALILDRWNSVAGDMRMIGAWLTEIRDRELYRPQYSGFREYCKKELPFGRRRAYQIIEAEAVIAELPASVQGLAHNDWQVQELAKVPPGKRAEVLEKATAAAEREGKPLTARHIREAGIEFRHAAKMALALSREEDDARRFKRVWRNASLQSRRNILRWVFNKGGMSKLWPGWKSPRDLPAPDARGETATLSAAVKSPLTRRDLAQN
jgi:hypothetical protein